MRRLILAIAMMMVATAGWAGCFPSFPSFGRWQDGCGAEWWNDSSLTFYAPFDDPADPLRLIRGTGTLTFTRATTATYVHPTTGLITTAASGTLRIESNGALIEGQRTNLALNSEAFNSWSSVTSNTNVVVAPDGTTTAERVTELVQSQHFGYQGVTTEVTAGGKHTFTVYMKLTGTGDGDNTVDIGITRAGAGTYEEYYKEITLTSSWQRYDVTKTWINNQTGINAIITRPDATDATVVDIWGAQLEAGAFPSSYIPTTAAAVTRNEDVLTFAGTGNVSDTAGAISLYVDTAYVETGAPTAFRHGVSNNSTNTGRLAYFAFGTGGGYSSISDGTNTATYSLNHAVNTVYKFASRWETGVRVSHVVNGGTIANSAAYDGSVGASGTFAIGSEGGGGLIYGHIKNLRIWDRAFTDAQLQSITR